MELTGSQVKYEKRAQANPPFSGLDTRCMKTPLPQGGETGRQGAAWGEEGKGDMAVGVP